MKSMKLSCARIMALISGCVALAMVSGCGGGGGSDSTALVDETAPTITNAKAVTPSDFSFKGGSVTIQADVTDNVGVASVAAAVSKDGVLIDNGQVTLVLSTGSTYIAVVDAPANTSSDDVACDVVLVASDAAGNQSGTQFSFTVPSAGGDPPPPPSVSE